VTYDILSSKTNHLNFHYTKFPFTELQGKLPFSEKPSRNSCHESNASNPNFSFHLIKMDPFIIFKSVRGSTVSTVTRIYDGRSGVQILEGARELSLLQNIQISSSTHPVSNSMKTKAFSVAVKWPWQTL
jgi:hypothetical protein